ncbi:MAG TPA: phosphate ABC transporter ATP-binding protein PstB [Dehalococcoidia bacterium]
MRQSEITGEMELPQSFARTISSLEHMTSETTRQDILGSGAEPAAAGQQGEAIRSPAEETVFSLRDVGVTYGPKRAISGITLNMPLQRVTALIGPSGCGKSTLLRCLNRMNDLIPNARVSGTVEYHGTNIYDRSVDAVEVRRRIGMVFQKPNPFPKTITDNVAFGARINGIKGNMDDIVERSLRQAALWDEVKDDLKKSALALSGGQQQRLCIARALAVQPDVILMDEPCSSLDPIATLKIEDLIRELCQNYSIIIVTHNMQQAARVSDYTAFLLAAEHGLNGRLIEYGPTTEIFTHPRERRTEDYITGRFG